MFAAARTALLEELMRFIREDRLTALSPVVMKVGLPVYSPDMKGSFKLLGWVCYVLCV